jgi:lipoate-protein ligase A
VLPWEIADGPGNMAADEVLLESAAAGVASLRFYGWTQATVSLGYFQEANSRLHHPLLAGLAWVRRPSGGSALVHHHEVTYALALPAGPPWQGRAGECVVCVHAVLVAALGKLGVAVRSCGPGETRKLDPVLCFLHHTAGDLLIGPHKVVGSAQRKRRGAVMQHGGILLATSPHTPQLPGIAELTGRRLEPRELAQAVVAELAAATGWLLVAGGWGVDERNQIDRIATEKYANPRWNEKR